MPPTWREVNQRNVGRRAGKFPWPAPQVRTRLREPVRKKRKPAAFKDWLRAKDVLIDFLLSKLKMRA